MQRIFVYAHDAYGMGNTRRMTAVASHLSQAFDTANVLLASGSPVLQGFRLPDRVDYIKLPSVTRTDRERYETRYLTTGIGDTIRLRASLLRAAIEDFRPDVVLVDKKPFGIMDELRPALADLRRTRPSARTVLILRDILDDPARTIPHQTASGFERDIDEWYDHVAVLGSRDLFDLGREYQWSAQTTAKVSYCGYLRTPQGKRSRRQVRAECGVAGGEALVLINAGGGEDGASLMTQALEAVALLRERPGTPAARALVVTGPHAPLAVVEQLRARAAAIEGVIVRDFVDDMASFVSAADVTVSMGGYNTVCDILSCGRRAIVVPRVAPVREQWVRAERMAQRGWFHTIHPDMVSPLVLAEAMAGELATGRRPKRNGEMALDGLEQLSACLSRLAHRGASIDRPAPAGAVAVGRRAIGVAATPSAPSVGAPSPASGPSRRAIFHVGIR